MVMTESVARLPLCPRQGFNASPFWLCALLLLGVAALVINDLTLRLPGTPWLQALWQPDEGDIRQLVVHYSWLPRLCMAALCGATLALAGTVMQQVLRNPLASPTTLGVASGAQLALVVATLWAPGLLLIGREWVAMAGGGAAALLVVSLYLSALNTSLMLIQQQDMNAVFIWGSGSLSQNSWNGVDFLLPRLGLGLLLLLPLLRPLGVLELDDNGAKSLGVPLQFLRFSSLTLAVFLSACVVSVVGVIGFIGLAAPALGALLLCVPGLSIQYLAGSLAELIPTGAATALLGAPLLLWLLPRLQLSGGQPRGESAAAPLRYPRPTLRLLQLGAVLLASLLLALAIGKGLEGWQWQLSDLQLLDWRLPRVTAAAAAGLMLAIAGTLIQRLTGNPMASPEVLGISAGAALGLIAVLFLLPYSGLPAQLALGGLGALLTLLLLL